MTAAPRRGRRSPTSSLSAPDPSGFTATSTYIEGAGASFDPLSLAADDGHLVAGRTRIVAGTGVAAALELPMGLEDPAALRAVVEWLGAVEHHAPPGTDGVGDESGSEPVAAQSPAPSIVAVGAFPFDRSAPATLVVPAVSWCRSADGRAWRSTVARRTSLAPKTPKAPVPPHAAPREGDRLHEPTLVERPPGADYAAAVESVVADIGAGHLSKVVLARMVDVALASPVRAARVLDILWGSDPAFSPFSVPVEGGRLVGASPELIVSRTGTTVVSHAFAGTVPLGALAGDDPAGRLFGSAKDRGEHRLVVDEIAATLGPRCSRLDVPSTPSVVPLRSDARLGTIITGRLRHDAPDSALELLALLHPTPAVGGVPRAEALKRISALEPEPRGYWAGVTGWVDAAGDGEWVLAIRSALLRGGHAGFHASVHAGAGIVGDSDPDAELAETTVKLSPVLDALWPGAASLL